MADLLVDLGNTRIKLGWLDDGLQVLAAVETPADILARVPGMPERIWLSTVARERRTEELVRTLAVLNGELVRVTVDRYRHCLPTRYNPAQLGLDRWLAALAAHERAGGACVVVDAGTATTIDLIDADGAHAGGYILPGEGLMVRSIEEATAIRLSRDSSGCGSAIPITTVDAVRCGSLQAQAALIEQACHALGPACPVLIGGGNAHALLPLLHGESRLVEQLVLEGLACLGRRESVCAG